jgi:hypothetical protein
LEGEPASHRDLKTFLRFSTITLQNTIYNGYHCVWLLASIKDAIADEK